MWIEFWHASHEFPNEQTEPTDLWQKHDFAVYLYLPVTIQFEKITCYHLLAKYTGVHIAVFFDNRHHQCN